MSRFEKQEKYRPVFAIYSYLSETRAEAEEQFATQANSKGKKAVSKAGTQVVTKASLSRGKATMQVRLSAAEHV